MRSHIAWIVGMVLALACQLASAQNVIKDYYCDAPRRFSPQTPQQVGHVFRVQMGHGGRFYNCDCQEDKRFSPYINWHCQSPAYKYWPFRFDLNQQLCEVKQRIRWGKGCDIPEYVVPTNPLDPWGVRIADSTPGSATFPDYTAVSRTSSEQRTPVIASTPPPGNDNSMLPAGSRPFANTPQEFKLIDHANQQARSGLLWGTPVRIGDLSSESANPSSRR